jgi:hypothetical protein
MQSPLYAKMPFDCQPSSAGVAINSLTIGLIGTKYQYHILINNIIRGYISVHLYSNSQVTLHYIHNYHI